jgi:hypothetical protein
MGGVTSGDSSSSSRSRSPPRFPPTSQTLPQTLGIEIQNGANIFEGQCSLGVDVTPQNPLLRFVEKLSAIVFAGKGVLLKAPDGICEYGNQEPVLPAPVEHELAQCADKLHRQQRVWLHHLRVSSSHFGVHSGPPTRRKYGTQTLRRSHEAMKLSSVFAAEVSCADGWGLGRRGCCRQQR